MHDYNLRFKSKVCSQTIYWIREATGFVLVTLELLGGVSTKPFSVLVTPSELSPVSAKGMVIPYIAKFSRWKSFTVVN